MAGPWCVPFHATLRGDRTFQFIPSQVRGRGSTRQQRHRAQVGKCKPRGETGTQRDPRPPGWGTLPEQPLGCTEEMTGAAVRSVPTGDAGWAGTECSPGGRRHI